MQKSKNSDFKMFENAPYELPDPKALMDAQLLGFRELEKIYGPLLVTLLIKHALHFIAQRIGEERHNVIIMFLGVRLTNPFLSK